MNKNAKGGIKPVFLRLMKNPAIYAGFGLIFNIF